MIKNCSALVWLFFLLAACSGDTYRKIRLDLPPFSPVRLADYDEILITDFLVTKAPEGLDLNKEVAQYFKLELEKKFRGNVFHLPFPIDRDEAFQDAATWKPLASASGSRLVMTGKAALSQETRKAILSRPVRRTEEETLSPAKKIEERRVFTLELSVYLIRPDTGEVLLHRDFKETITYTNLQQRADFAFHDLAQRVRVQFFRPLLGEERLQERYLLLR